MTNIQIVCSDQTWVNFNENAIFNASAICEWKLPSHNTIQLIWIELVKLPKPGGNMQHWWMVATCGAPNYSRLFISYLLFAKFNYLDWWCFGGFGSASFACGFYLYIFSEFVTWKYSRPYCKIAKTLMKCIFMSIIYAHMFSLFEIIHFINKLSTHSRVWYDDGFLGVESSYLNSANNIVLR